MSNSTVFQEKRTALQNTARKIIDGAFNQGRPLRPAEEADLEGIRAKLDAFGRTRDIATRFNMDVLEHVSDGIGLADLVRGLHSGGGRLDVAIQCTSVSNPGLSRALSAGTATSGGYAVPQGFHAEAIQALLPLVAVRKLNPVILPMPHGNITWPKIGTASTPAYGTENTSVAVTQPAFQALNLTARKMGAMVPVSNTFLRSSSPAGDTIIKSDLMNSVGSLEDLNFLRGDGTQYTPRGLRNWCLPANVLVISGATQLMTIDYDLGRLESALTSANVKMLRPAWIFNPRTETFLRNLRGTGDAKAYPEMDAGMLRGKPYATSTNVPVNLGIGANASEIYLADFADVVIAEYPLLIDASGAAQYTDPATGLKVSAFSADQTVIRIISQADIGMRHSESLAVLTGVTWQS
jgi:HK97 family phage major capsid protein